MYQALTERNRDRTLFRGLLSQRYGALQRLAPADHLFHQANALGSGGIDALATQDHALGPALTYQPGQALGAAGAGQQADTRFGQSHLGLFLGDADIAGHGDLKPATHCKTVDRGDGDAAKIRQRLERLAKILRHRAGGGRVAIGEKFQVCTGGKELFPGTGNDQRINGSVVIELPHQILQRRQALDIPGIGAGIVDSQHGRMAAQFHFQFLRNTQTHLITSNAPSINIRRDIITRMISLVPSSIWCTRVSRTCRSIGYSFI